jgi:hypothetical protein
MMTDLDDQEISDLIGAINRQRYWLQTDAGNENEIRKLIKRLNTLEDKLGRLLGH